MTVDLFTRLGGGTQRGGAIPYLVPSSVDFEHRNRTIPIDFVTGRVPRLALCLDDRNLVRGKYDRAERSHTRCRTEIN